MKDFFNFKGMLNEDFDKESITNQSTKERLLNYLYRTEEGGDWQELFVEFLNYAIFLIPYSTNRFITAVWITITHVNS